MNRRSFLKRTPGLLGLGTLLSGLTFEGARPKGAVLDGHADSIRIDPNSIKETDYPLCVDEETLDWEHHPIDPHRTEILM